MSDIIENGFYLALVGDGDDAEPIRVQDGQWFSVGCADPHDMGSVLIVRAVSTIVPTREQLRKMARSEAEQEAWEASMKKLRETNYDAYRRKFYQRHGRYPGHRRFA